MHAFIPTHSSNRNCLQLKLKTPEQFLVQSILNKKKGAFNQLYQMYAENLLGVLMKILNQQETAEDLLQEVFLKIQRYLPLYDDKKARLFTWILNIARNTAFDYLRLKSSRQSKSTVEMEDHHAELESFSQSVNTDVIGLKKMVLGLNEKHRTILELCYYQGYTHKEIAEELNMPLGSVKTSIRQAVLILRGFFLLPN
ncbi:RNA polymerase sigma factor [Pedobacter endophyticus]|uniref:RNA polymerase sigma factor n=1 Tax=Pedobacter endophyticus TaxID=2789740 RepID=A0A7U3SQA6_9SPHI|nr:RNA polymerase sigma factor [Pedobacter endophyticus]QPH38916.1 RNA polymerase sigma factor [Pedobacter endophyticus]